MKYSYIYICRYFMVGSNGIEPSTSRLSGVRSNRLSYKPIRLLHPSVIILTVTGKESRTVRQTLLPVD